MTTDIKWSSVLKLLAVTQIRPSLKKMSVGGNISDKKVKRKEGNFYFFLRNTFNILGMWFLQIFGFQKENMK